MSTVLKRTTKCHNTWDIEKEEYRDNQKRQDFTIQWLNEHLKWQRL